MATEATSRTRTLGARLRSLAADESLRAAWRAFWISRAAILAAAVYAALSLGANGEDLPLENARKFDVPSLTHALGGFGDTLLSPLARWDAAWFLTIADSGYDEGAARAAFFPLYPLLTRGVAELGGGSNGALLIGSYLVALAAFMGALYLLHRLVCLELGRPLAMPTLVLLCAFPGSLYFGAPYSESLFLLLSVGAFYAARTGNWAWAGVCAGAASATRSAGVLLILPLALLYLAERGRAGRGAWAWLLLAPVGVVAYAAHLEVTTGDGLAFMDVQQVWYRDFGLGIWDATVAAFDGARQLLSGSREPVYFTEAGGDPFRVASLNLMLYAFMVVALIGTVGAFRRLPLAYGAYTAAALALPLFFPVGPQPLMSLPRFMAVLFPIFMWLALWCEERKATPAVAAVLATVMGMFVTQFATWHWIS